MSGSGPSHSTFPVAIIQAYIGSLVESTIIQSLFTGFYALMFFQTIAPLARQKMWAIIAALSGLFIAIILNLAAVWDILYDVVVTHNATRETMGEAELTTTHTFNEKMTYGTLALSVLMADSFLVWKAYVLWGESKIIGVTYSIICLAELVALPIYLIHEDITLGPIGFMDLYFAVSFLSTIIATVLIIYKIIHVSKQGNNDLSRYQYTIKILIESGMLYIVIMMLCAIFHFLKNFGHNTPAVIHATQDLDAILVPVTGIAPTLITARNVATQNRKSRRRPDIEAPPANGHQSEFVVSRLDFRRYNSTVEFPTEEENTTEKWGKNIQTRTV